MQRIDGPTRSANLPAPAAVGTGNSAPGYFQKGDPLAGTAPTTLDVDWANGIQEEIASVIEHAGMELDKANRSQLLAALIGLFVPKGGGSDFFFGPNEFSMPLGGGVILKGGSVAAFQEGVVTRDFAQPFPTSCFLVLATAVNGTGSIDRNIWAQRHSKSAQSFGVMLQLSGGSGANSIDGFDWIALGN